MRIFGSGRQKPLALAALPPEPKPAQAHWLAPLLLFLGAGLMMLTFVTFPPAPPTDSAAAFEADPSLSMVLNYVQDRGMQFGTDLVYTYGPLGYLVFPYFHPHLAGLRMGVDVGLCLLTALGIALVAARLPLVWRCLLVAAFVWVAPNLETRTDLVLNTALFCWGLLCFVETGRKLHFFALTFAALAAFMALAKVSFLFVGGACVILVTLELLTRRLTAVALELLFAFTACFVLGWLLAGQNLSHLGAWLANSYAVVRGYNAALGWEELELPSRSGFLLAMLMAGLVLLRTLNAFETGGSRWRRPLLLAWTGLLALTAWKHGYVRGYVSNVAMYFGFLPVLALGLEILPCDWATARRWTRVLGLTCSLLALVTLQWFFFGPWTNAVAQPFRAAAANLQCLLRPGEYESRMNAVIEANRRAGQLPRCRELIGAKPVDVFGRWQAYALFNDLQYHPAPVFQSYVACNARLMALNERFYLSKSAPEFVLFYLLSLDRKFPPLEDARVFRDLLINYQPVAAEGPLLLLKSRPTKTAPSLKLIREGTVSPGDPIDLRTFAETDLWMRIDLQPSLLGRLRTLLYRPPIVRLAFRDQPKGKLLFRQRAPPSMLSAGFLASPALLRNQDVLDLYAGKSVSRPGVCTVELLPGEQRYWRDTIRFRLFKIGNQLGRCITPDQAREIEASAPTAMGPGQEQPTPPIVNPLQEVRPVRPFNLFRSPRWRPTRPPTGGLGENLTYALFVLLPVASSGGLILLARRRKRGQAPTGWIALLTGNLLVFLLLASLCLLAGETYFRFFYDTTDSLGYTRVCERWVERHWHANTAGCRDDVEYAPTIPAGKHRVTFVGDSFAAGHGIKNVEDRFANILRRAHPDWDVHVLANVGLDTGAEQILMNRAFAKGYQVQDVVLVYCLNDVADLMPDEGQAAQQLFAALDQSNFLVQDSYFINLLYHRYQAWRAPALKDYFAFVDRGYRGPVWGQQQARLTEFRDTIQRHGGHLWVVTFPFLDQLGPKYRFQFVHDELDAFWRNLNVPHLDLLPIFKDLPAQALTVNRYDAHPNEYANRLAAAAIDKFLSPP